MKNIEEKNVLLDQVDQEIKEISERIYVLCSKLTHSKAGKTSSMYYVSLEEKLKIEEKISSLQAKLEQMESQREPTDEELLRAEQELLTFQEEDLF
ncbi:MAG: hypothetical protein GXP45_01305 [bacterium]|nr:hypothetical protein [bacterium]